VSPIRAEDDPADREYLHSLRAIGVGHRASDDPDDGEHFMRHRRYERARTVLLCMILAGITTLAILYPIEVQNNKNDRSNCVIINSIPTLLADQANQSANGVLGRGQPGKRGYVPPFKFEGTTLEDFKPLIVAQARQSRVRAVQYARTVRNCKQAFPQPEFFGLDIVPGD
jgi:hypothetical protein